MSELIQETTALQNQNLWRGLESQRTDSISGDFAALLGKFHEFQSRVEMVQTLIHLSKSTGSYVQLLETYGFFPVLIGEDKRPVFLFNFMQVLDEQIDYDKVKEELPNLSYAQIDGAVSFLKKVTQLNILGIDINDIENEYELEDAELLDQLKQGLANQEIARVLYNDQPKG